MKLRGWRIVREPYLPNDGRLYWTIGMEPTLFCGLTEYRRLVWEDDADEWYAAELERTKDNAPA